MTIKARIILSQDVDLKSTSPVVQHQQSSQDYCLLFDTRSPEFEEMKDYLEQEYGAGSKGYARTVKEVTIHNHTQATFISKDERLKGYTGTGVDVVKTPVYPFNVDEKGQFSFKTGDRAGGVFFSGALKSTILEDLENSKGILEKKGVTFEFTDETLAPAQSYKR